MRKKTKKDQGESKGMSKESLQKIRNALDPACACYVLITCSAPSEKGNMEVELHFEGDESLAAFLIDNASMRFNERISLSK